MKDEERMEDGGWRLLNSLPHPPFNAKGGKDAKGAKEFWG
jgi:hypothetical protein